jgi:benzoate 4-monooxygenase
MALVDLLLSVVTSWLAIPAAIAIVLGWYLYAYFVTFSHLRGLPAPFPAQFTNLWLLYVCRRGARYKTMHRLHKELGPVIRIAPNHVSILDDDAIPIIYGHGNGFLKS